MATKKKKTTTVPRGRKQYLFGVKARGGFNYEAQPKEVQDYVRRYRGDTAAGKMGLTRYGDVHREDIAKEHADRIKLRERNPYIDPAGHTMKAAKNRLKRGWTTSERGRGVKGAAKTYVKHGMSAKAAAKRARANHAVKFGVDPYHK